MSDAANAFAISIDVERDYRTDGVLTTRGLEEGLPKFLDLLKRHGVPCDLMVSGEVASRTFEVLGGLRNAFPIGCHGNRHVPGYLGRMSPYQQEQEIQTATETITKTLGIRPRTFRAPNFSISGDSLRILERKGYEVDSSVLPGRFVKKWRVLSLVDHRQASANPYNADYENPTRPGESRILEVPVTPNPLAHGAPIGLGFLAENGVERTIRAIRTALGRYIIFLAHSWEMVRWCDSDNVQPWVRSASDAKTDRFEALLSRLDRFRFLTLLDIWREQSPIT